jgi:hypothetical protein
MTIGSDLTERGHHLTDEHVVELGDIPIAVQTQPGRCLDHSRDRLAVRCDERSDPSIAAAIQPQPQHLTDFEHRNLPE